MVLYLIGVIIAAGMVGFDTPIDKADGSSLPHLLMASLGWPIIVAAGFGAACRMFNAKRVAEDGGRPWVDK